jgi:Gpi18-like mannosyltransferase
MDARAKIQTFWARIDKRYLILLIAGSFLALLIRLYLLKFKSPDFYCCLRTWYYQVRYYGTGAFRREFSNYNLPYLYVLFLVDRLFPGLQNVVAIKLPSLVADFGCAALVHEIVRLRIPSRMVALLAYMATLLAPTVVLNGAFWGQADSIYAAFTLLCLYAILTRRPWIAALAFGLAVAFKLQGVFLGPLLLALWIKGQFNWKHMLLVPAVLLAALVPAWIQGRSFTSLLLIYVEQTKSYDALTLNAPNIYAWIPGNGKVFGMFLPAAITIAAAIAGIFVVLLILGQARMNRALVLQAATLCLVLVPFVTPKMHERYFYTAEVVTIAFAFYFPSYFFVPLLVSLAGYFSYADSILKPYGAIVVPQPILAFAMLFVVVVLVRQFIMGLYPNLIAGPSPTADNSEP